MTDTARALGGSDLPRIGVNPYTRVGAVVLSTCLLIWLLVFGFSLRFSDSCVALLHEAGLDGTSTQAVRILPTPEYQCIHGSGQVVTDPGFPLIFWGTTSGLGLLVAAGTVWVVHGFLLVARAAQRD